MASLLKTPVAPRQVAEILGAVAVILWRIVTCPAGGFWIDWITLLAVYWVAAVALEGKRALAPVTAAFVALLMGLYLWGHAPHAVEFLRTVR